MDINQYIADELKVAVEQVEATVQLLSEGATVPFIARYRKEATGGLTDTQLRQLEERLVYLKELEDRRATILESIAQQGQLNDELKQVILNATDKARLEDLYLPYKPKRRTKAQIAKEAGLEPLAILLLENPALNPIESAQSYLNEEHHVSTPELALEGARHILLERFSESADLLSKLREFVWDNGLLVSQVIKGKEKEAIKFSDYFDYQEPLKKVPSHRALAVFRGQNEEHLRVKIDFKEANEEWVCIQEIAQTFNIHNQSRAADAWLWQTIEWTWKIKLKLKIEMDLLSRLRTLAEQEAIKVFQDNLKNLLMAAPAGHKVTMGLDPGLRTGVKVVIVDGTGKLLIHSTIFPHPPKNDWDSSIEKLNKLCRHYQVDLISIGNGTASRETERLVAELAKKHSELKFTKVVISEAGASVYSASEVAANEFPDLDVSFRGAVSIARRLQDPLAELVKIDPKAIGVGQYQHDVNQIKLNQSLSAVLEDCVNAVGADINTASIPLLKSIAGLNETVAKNIITYRESHGRFSTRESIKQVPRLGGKTYEQAIGFLRIIGGDNPLDASAVHPEAYPLVEKILQKTGQPLAVLMGNTKMIHALSPNDFVSEQFGLPTVKDIFLELQKPGRDPRPEFKTAQFSEGIESLEHLKIGMQLEGSVTNVTNFGAFVDIGVHQDGLVHISQLANQYVSDPSTVVKVGQIVQVKVLEVDLARKRIQLTMRLEEKVMADPVEKKFKSKPMSSKQVKKEVTPANNALADAFLKALNK